MQDEAIIIILVYHYFTSIQMNLGGAKDRPLPSDIWKEVQGKL